MVKDKQENNQERLTATQLMEAVAAEVEIFDVRLVEAAVRLDLDNWQQPTAPSVGFRTEFVRDEENNCINVKALFRLDVKNEGDESEKSVVLIESTFLLHYRLPDISKFTDNHIHAFAAINGTYSAWPFWREFIYTTLARMGLPPVTMPVLRLSEQIDNVEKALQDDDTH